MSSSERVPCDFCGERTAVLFCRADTAKLCLPCDQQVHTANLLSRKHVRSQICDNCGNEPVSVRCFTDNLILCQECDWDVHGSCSVSDAHVRSAVEGFSGCPSALELAALWGLDLEQGRKDEENQVPMMAMMMDNFGMQLDSWVLGSNELIVPSDTTFKKRGSCGSSCGRYKQVLCKQLEELLKSGVVGGDGDDGDRDRDCDREGACDGDGDGEAGEGLMVPEMSERLKWSRDVEEINGGGGGGVNQQWNATTTNPSGGQSSQIWDFNLGQSRGPEDTSRVEAAYVGKGAASSFTINNFVDHMNETCSTNVKGVKEIKKDDYKRSTSGQVQPTKSESNNRPITFGSEKGSNSSSDLHFTEHIAGTSCKTTRLVATKADLERLAQNRGDAMQRYKEKRKTRRYDKTISSQMASGSAAVVLRCCFFGGSGCVGQFRSSADVGSDAGFNLHCNNLDKTVLELPMSGTFLVDEINYQKQQISISDPENCMVKRLLTFNTSGSPFSYGFSFYYTFLTCPNEVVIPIVKGLYVPVDVIYKDVITEEKGFSTVPWLGNVLLEWSSPNCRGCEKESLRCGFKNKASLEVKYLADPPDETKSRLRPLIITLCIIGGITATCIAAIRIYNSERFVNQRRQNAAITARNTTQQPRGVVVTTGLDQSTIESYKKVELGESRRLPGTNGIICPICLSEYASKETVRCMPECDHCFHVQCIDEWLKIHSSCPVCRNSRS